MERLSSCYFCGTAVDAPLEDYPVRPGSAGEELVVTLCPTCRRKLTTIVRRVVDDPPGGEVEPDEPSMADDVVEDDAEILDDAIGDDEGSDAAPPVDDVGDGDEPPEPEASVDDAAVSVLEYNRVMRLLENRELPVERVAFRELATSAYELAPGTVDAVLDAAIDGGLLAEDEEGQLVRAPDRDPDDEAAEGDDGATE